MGVVLDGRWGGWDGMAWHGMTGATARGRGGLASSLLVAQRSGSLTVAWQRATLHGPGPPSRPSSMAWHGMARRPPGGKRGEPGGSRRGRGFRWGAGTRASSPGVGEGTRGARGAGLGRPRAFASWQQKMDRWEAPRRGGNRGEGPGRRGQAPPCVGPRGTQGAPRPLWLAWRMEDGGWRMVRFAGSWEACARGRPGWWQGEGPRLDAYMYVCLWARGALSRVDFVDWGGRWCGSLSSTHSIYISTQCNDPRQKASLVVGGLRAPPRRRCEGRGLAQGAHRGPRRLPLQRELVHVFF